MLGKQYDCVDRERPFQRTSAHDAAEKGTGAPVREHLRSLMCDNGEEERPAWHPGSAEIWHRWLSLSFIAEHTVEPRIQHSDLVESVCCMPVHLPSRTPDLRNLAH